MRIARAVLRVVQRVRRAVADVAPGGPGGPGRASRQAERNLTPRLLAQLLRLVDELQPVGAA